MRVDPPRSTAPITRPVLERLSAIAAEDQADRFDRRPRWAVYRDRVICVVLCQGAALHFVNGTNGVKDLDVWTFYALSHEAGQFPPRWPRPARQFDETPFKGRYIDLLARSLPVEPSAEPLAVLHAYLSHPKTETARRLAQKAVVLLDPEPLRGVVAWPPKAADTS